MRNAKQPLMISKINCLRRCLALFVLGLLAFQSTSAQQVHAAFSTIPSSGVGCSPLTVTFINTSTGANSYHWTFGNGNFSSQSSPSAVYTSPNTYTICLVAWDSLNVSNRDSICHTITALPGPTVDFTSPDTMTCAPATVHFQDLTTFSGSATGSSYYWDFGDGNIDTVQNPIHAYPTTGCYPVTLQVTNSFGCQKTLTKPCFIHVGTKVPASFTNSTPTACVVPYTVNFTNTSPAGAASYSWNFGDNSPTGTLTTATPTNPSHTYNTAGTYTVTLVTVGPTGCRDTVIKTNLVNVGASPSFTPTTATACAGSTLTFTNTSQPIPLSTAWAYSSGGNSTTFNATHTFNTPGTITVQLINTYANCTDTVSHTVTIKPTPVASFTVSNNKSCVAPWTVSFDASGTTGAASYTWNFGDITPPVTTPGPLTTHTYTTYGNFTVALTATGANGCTAVKSLPSIVNIVRPHTTVTGLPQSGCAPQMVCPVPTLVSADTVATYTWNWGDNTTSVGATPCHTYNVPGQYTVTLYVATATGCTDTVKFINGVKVGAPAQANFTWTPHNVCASQQVCFTNTSTGTIDQYDWHFGDNGTSGLQNPCYQYNDTGWFNVTLIVSNFSCADSIRIDSAVHVLAPIANFSVVNDCNNKYIKVFNDLSIIGSNTSYTWDFGDGTIITTAGSVTHTYNTQGVYNVTLSLTDGACTNTKTIVVTVADIHAGFTPNKIMFCAGIGDQMVLTPTFSNAYLATAVWDFGDGTPPITNNGTTTSYSYGITGIHHVKLTTTDVNGCIDSASIQVTVHGPHALVQGINVNVCVGNSDITFTDLSTTDGIGDHIIKWIWDWNDGTPQDSSGIQPFHHYFSSAGVYDVHLTVRDEFGCYSVTGSATPLVIKKPHGAFSADTLSCINKPIFFIDSTTGTAPLSEVWNFGFGAPFPISPVPTPNTFTRFYPSPGVYTITLITTDGDGCKDTLVKPNYVVIKKPVASFTVSDSAVSCPPLIAHFTNTSTDFNQVHWDFGDGSASILQNPTHIYNVAGSYIATLYANSPGGCVDSMKVHIDVRGPGGTFNFVPLTGCNPLSVQFTAHTHNRDSLVWDAGDGNVLWGVDSTWSHTYTALGSYIPRIILVDTAGCVVPIQSPDTVQVYGATAKFATDKHYLCDSGLVNFTDSSITNNAIGSWLWDFGDLSPTSNLQNPSHMYTTPGVHIVHLTVTTIAGCTNTSVADTVTVWAGPRINITASSLLACSPTIITYGGNVTAGNALALQYQWNFGDASLSNLQNPPGHSYTAGTYGVTLIATDQHQCPNKDSVTLTVNPSPDVTQVQSEVLCNGSNTTAVNFTGSIPGTVFSWTGSTSAIGLASSGTGNIASFVAVNNTNAPIVDTIKVTPSYTGSGLTCTGTIMTYTITVNPTPSVANVANDTLCANSNYAGVTFTAPVTGTVLSWTNDNPAIGLPASGTGNIPGFVTVNGGTTPIIGNITVTPTFSNGGVTCTGAPKSFSITVLPVPAIINPLVDQVWCNGSATTAVTLNANAVVAQYSWTNSNASIGLPASGTGNTIASFPATNITNAPIAGTINVSAVFTSGTHSCSATPGSYVVTVNPTPSVNAIANDTLCNNSTATINFTAPVVGTVLNWVNDNPAIGLAASGAGNISFTATNAGNSAITGNITVTPSYTNGGQTCTGTPKTFSITVNPSPTINQIGNDTFCVNVATPVINLVPGGSNAVYTWTNSNPAIGLGANGTGDIPSFVATNTTVSPLVGNIHVTAVFTNGTQTCAATPLDFQILVNPKPVMNPVSDIVYCNRVSTSPVVFTSSAPGTLYAWTNSDTTIGLAASGIGNIPVFTATDTTTVPVIATITVIPQLPNGTQLCGGDTITFHITVNPTPVVSIVSSNPLPMLCIGRSDTLTASGALSYQWGPSPWLNTTVGPVVIVTPDSTRIFSVTGTNIYNCTDKAFDTVVLKQKYFLSVDTSYYEYCKPGSAQLNALAGADVYVWSPANGLSDTTIHNPIASPDSLTTYVVTAIDTLGCQAIQTDTVVVHPWPIPTVNITPGPDVNAIAGAPIQLNSHSSADVLTWKWLPAFDLSCVDCPNPMLTPSQTTTYRVLVKNGGGCSEFASVTVYVTCDQGNVFIPNTFSPNGDGMNDIFYVRTTGVQQIRALRVFNRWGQLVYERTKFNPNDPAGGWDGTFNGQKAPSDVYVYTCEVVCTTSQVLELKGDLTLLR